MTILLDFKTASLIFLVLISGCLRILFKEEIAKRDFKYLKALMDKKGHVDSLVYKAIELGELLKCKEFYGTCQHAKNCWVTRRGWCQQEKDMKMKNF